MKRKLINWKVSQKKISRWKQAEKKDGKDKGDTIRAQHFRRKGRMDRAIFEEIAAEKVIYFFSSFYRELSSEFSFLLRELK